MTDPARRRRIEEVCDAALERDALERDAFVAAACGHDSALRQEVEALLKHTPTAEGFLVASLGAVAANVLGEQRRTLLVGHEIGSYKILSQLGVGGMGEVYRARDAKLGRDVAIKVLPLSFANDPGRRARLEREARLLAALNHPHIATIHGLEEADGVRALVMELVEGPTLAEKLAYDPRRKAKPGLPLAEALTIGAQIAEALEAAHEKGIIHRDLKPANIKIGDDGHVTVLDFGLAKALSSDVPGGDLSNLPSITASDFQAGAIVGTPAYMSPEQARGQSIDKRADIWAFGCVLYEMLAGRAAFPGATISDTIAAILDREPDWDALPPDTPAGIGHVLRRCLDKDPKRRLRDIGDARIELEEARTTPAREAGSAARPGVSRRSVGFALALLTVMVIGVAATIYWRRPALFVTRLDVVTPPTTDPFSFALSPDGRALVFVANGDNGSQLWLRRFDQVTAEPLKGTDGADGLMLPFWSPDSRAIGFFADARLKRLDLDGSAPQVLADAPNARGGTWNRDGVILFAPSNNSRLMRVPATGGTSLSVTQFAEGETYHAWPQFLPDGRRFLFFVGPVGSGGAISLGSLDGGTPARLLTADTAAMFAPPDELLLVRGGTLGAMRFDSLRESRGEAFTSVAQSVGSEGGNVKHGAVSVSMAGVLAYRGGETTGRQLVWVDRTGRTLETLWPLDDAGLGAPMLARDGRRVAATRIVQGNADVWVIDVARKSIGRFTFDPADDVSPVWSPDGSRMVFRTNRNGKYDLFEKPADGSAIEQPLLVTGQNKQSLDWSPDGRFFLYATQDPKTESDIWALPLEGEGKPFPVVQTGFEDAQGQFSPDGRWVAYASDETGRYEIYVTSFPNPRGKWQISTAGGVYPRWRSDGRELFYVSPDNRLMAVSMQIAAPTTVAPAPPLALFQTRLTSGNLGIAGYAARPQYAVADDGRFLMNVDVQRADTPPITIVQNWTALLKR